MRPSVRTSRLTLRPLAVNDLIPLQQMADDCAIADSMISVPHPFTLAHARSWIAEPQHRYFATCWQASGDLVGVIALRDIDGEHRQAELSFLVGQLHWGRGIATEASAGLIDFGFRDLELNRIVAYHMVRNPASGRVLARLGFQLEGILRQRVRKLGIYEDVAAYAILRSAYSA